MTVGGVTQVLSAKYPDTSKWGDLTSEEQASWIDDVLGALRKGPFPYPEQITDPERDAIWKHLRGLSPDLSLATAGLKLCYSFFPNRYHARYQGRSSAYEAWFEDKPLRAAIRWQFRVGDPVTPSRVLRAVTANARTPTIFRPAVAKALYQRYCPAGGVVWDPCAGFGGRLVGALAAGVGKYIGTDVAPETVEGNRKLAVWMGASGLVEIHQEDAAKFQPPEVDMVFTSPPYFRQEQYAGGDQSWAAYTDFESWVAGFLRPVVKTSWGVLKPGGCLILNVADVREGSGTIPLVERTRQVALGGGFTLETELQMPISPLGRRATSGEPILVFRKGPILAPEG